jgi:hypothetical protein
MLYKKIFQQITGFQIAIGEGNFIYDIGNNRTKNRQNTFTTGSNNFSCRRKHYPD